MQTETIAAELCEFLHERILAPGVAVTPETPLEDIGVDSFALMELILFVERRYGLVLPPEALVPEHLASVAALSHYCAAHLPVDD
ncbi:acyl carrier protein [Methylomarinovum caldicuralii]|uniref:Acyl carrier protein n=1 Tax=Methylomarinovum caldicuralii TaxID=438856 RepID=A0AAU9CA45_9GAMM|nr:phosphopantetheine-binding protein [Methylomarinovum caldicuralii]BCX82461.1 acyl carrier protein [Methylomarinovum caldicuralii]